MKKITALVLAAMMVLSVFVLASCGGETETSEGGFTNSNASKTESSKAEESSKVTEESSTADVSEEVSEESSEEIVEVGVTQFISWKNAYYAGGIVGVRVTDPTSLKLDKLNEAVEYCIKKTDKKIIQIICWLGIAKLERK